MMISWEFQQLICKQQQIKDCYDALWQKIWTCLQTQNQIVTNLMIYIKGCKFVLVLYPSGLEKTIVGT